MPTVTLQTPPGRGAVATLLLTDASILDRPQPLFCAANGTSAQDQPIGRICYGRWGNDSPEDVVVCRIDSEQVEIHCHGGQAAVFRIIADLRSTGCEVITPFDHGNADDVVESECRQALAHATTVRTADILWQQCEGQLAAVFDELHRLAIPEASKRASQLLEWADFGRHLTVPWKVVLFGRPNVGKSSLINRLVGYGRSIVFDQPGTTRDVVTAETAFDGWPIEFSDTAGIRSDADELESTGIDHALTQLKAADLRLLILDTSQPLQEEDHQLLDAWPDAVIVSHKVDLPLAWTGSDSFESVQVSSLSGEGLNQLSQAIVSRLVPTVLSSGTPIPVCSRQVDVLTGLVERTLLDSRHSSRII